MFFQDTTQADTLSGLPDNFIFQISTDSKNRLWISTQKGLVYTEDGTHFIKPSFLKLPNFPTDFVNLVYEDSEKNVWVGLFRKGLVKIIGDFSSFEHYDSIEVDGEKIVLTDVVSLVEDPVNGHFWVGSRQLGLYAFNSKTKKGRYYAHKVNEKSSLSVNNRAFYFDEDQNLWSGSSQGLFLYNRKTDEFESVFGRNDDGSITRVQSLYIDRSKNLWIGTEFSGLRVADLKPKKFKRVDNRLLSSPVIWSVFEDIDGYVWLATEKGITILDPSKTKSEFILAKEQEPLIQNGDYVISLTGNKDFIWAGTTFTGIIEINRKTKAYRFVKRGVYSESNYINILAYNTVLDELVVGTLDGLGIYRFNQKKLDWYTSNPNDSLGILQTDVIWYIFFDSDHHTWFTHDLGVSVLNSQTRDIRHINPFQDSDIPNRSRATNVIAQDKNNFFWIGTENSLIKYEPKSDSIYYTFTTDDGLANAYIYAILVAENNDIWVSTNKGLSQLSADPEEKSGYHIRNYSVLDGLQSSEFNFNAFAKQKNGLFLFGGINGLNYFYPERIQLNLFDTPAFISEININNGKKIDHFNLFGKSRVEYDYGPNVYEFSIHALEFTAPKKNVFKYRLKGFETQWNEKKGNNKVIYTNLSPATYVFELKVANSDYIFGSNTARLELEVIPPFYLTKPFYATILVLSVLFIYWGVNYRERKLRKINEKLEMEVQKRTRELEKNEFIFKQITDNAAELISLLNHDGSIIYASPSHQVLLGYHPDELVAKNVFDFIHEDDIDRIKAEVKKLRQEGTLTFSEYRMRHKNGTWRTYQTAGSVIRNDEIDDLRYVMISHDITRQKRIENYLIESKNEAQRANQAKSAFLAGISHELRTPLNAILGFSQILVKETNLTPKQATYVETMLKSGNHLLDMINEVLDISRIEAGRMPVNYDNFSLKQLFKDVENIFRLDIQQKGLELHTFYEVGLPDYCFTDAGKLRQILINLIGNALKFTDKGYIRLHVSSESIQMHPKLQWNELVQAAEHSHSTGSRRLALKIVVEDTGRGIPSDKLQQIFEPFQQANAEKNYNEGTGLGLAISSRLIKLLGGTIDVRSVVGKGSIFECLIPILIVESPSFIITDSTQRIIGIKNLKNPKVLLVDDIEYNHTLLQEILEPIGFICSKAYNGKEAIEMAETYAPDLILMDLKMPVMDGSKSTKQIRKLFGNQIKIVAISASGFDDNELERKAAGFDAFILKPFKETFLLQTIAKVLSLEYVYENELPEAEKTSEERKNALILKEIKALGELEELFWDCVELMDWEKLRELNAQLNPSSQLYAYISEALENKDFMALIELSEKWRAD